MDPFDAYLQSTNEKKIIADFFDAKFPHFKTASLKDVYRVLDMGCGGGEVSMRFSERLKNNGVPFSYDALDTSPERIESFRKSAELAHAKEIHFINKSFEDISHVPDSYDLLIACQSLYYFSDLKATIATLLSMGKELFIVHHGSTGLEAFEEKFVDYIKKSKFGTSTCHDVRKILNALDSDSQYEITFEALTCDVNIAPCKDANSDESTALISFFLGNDFGSLSINIQDSMRNFLKNSYPDTIKREQGIFFISRK